MTAIQSLTMLRYESDTNGAGNVFSSEEQLEEHLALLNVGLANREKILQEGEISPNRHAEKLDPYSPKGKQSLFKTSQPLEQPALFRSLPVS